MDDNAFKKIVDKLKGFLDKEEDLVSELTKEQTIKAVDVELKETVEVVYMPDTKDLHGQWMSKSEIAKAETNFRDNLLKGLVKGNLFHAVSTDKFTIEDSWVTKVDGTYGDDSLFLPEGTWLARSKFHDDTLWEMKKSGEIGGLSFGGNAFVDESTGEITELTFDPTQSTEANFAYIEGVRD